MGDESISYDITALQQMTEYFDSCLEVAPVSELTKRGVIFVEDGNHGQNRPRQDEFAQTGVAFLRPPDLKNGRVDFQNCGRINDAGFRRVRKGIGQRQDIILTHRATVGRIAMTDDEAPEVFVTNPGTTIWRSTNPRTLDQRYLYCFMRSPAFMNQLWSQVGNNSTFDYVSLTQQRGLCVAFPLLPEQKAIAHVLGSLDDRIELNRRMNETLESMAQALFKSWFVDFDPVVDNALASGKEIPEELSEKAQARAALGDKRRPLPEEIRTLFPDEFSHSDELGWIPLGWEVSSVGTEFDVTMGQSPPGTTYNAYGEGIAFFQGRADFGFRYPSKRIYCTAPKRLAKKGDTLVSVRAPVGDVNMAQMDCCIGRGVSAVLHKGESRSFTYYAMLELREHFNKFEAEGTVFGSINQKDFRALLHLKIDKKLIEAFDLHAGALDGKIEQNSMAILCLSKLRDTLLPKLLSGELRIPDAEKMVEELAL